MKIFKNKLTLQKEISKDNCISFVPTMGGLHKGHLSLIRRAKNYNCKICVSIFVNPKQFNKKSDYQNYPRNQILCVFPDCKGIHFLSLDQ